MPSIKMSITKSELAKYRIYTEKGTMDEVAEQLKITTTSVSEAIRNVDKKIEDSIENLRIGLELELPFKRIDKLHLMKKLSYVFDEEKEVYPISKKKLIELKDLAKHEGISWQDLVTQTINEKLKELKEKLRLRDT